MREEHTVWRKKILVRSIADEFAEPDAYNKGYKNAL